MHFSTKPLWNPPLLQGGAPKTNLGKDTTPHTPPSVPLLCETPHIVERTPNDVRDTHTRYTHNAKRSRTSTMVSKQLIGIIHISHPQNDERSRKSTSHPCSGLYLVIVYILSITRPHMDRGQQLMQSTNHVDNQESYLLPGEQHLLLIWTVHKWTGVEMNKFLFSPHKQGAQMTRVTHRVTQLHHQHTKPGGGREKWLHTSHLNKQFNYLRSTHLSPHPTTIGWREELCICHLSLRTIKQNQIGVLWGKQSSPTIPACKHAKTPDTNSARGLIYCRPLI